MNKMNTVIKKIILEYCQGDEQLEFDYADLDDMVDRIAQYKQLTLTDVGYCNCDESKQLEEDYEIKHLINDTYQVVGKESNTVWKQGTMEECNDWVML